MAGIIAAGLEDPGDGTASAEERMNGATQLAKLRMEKRLAFLGTLGSNAPFIGLLGTVIGIIRAFHELNDAAGKVTAGLMAEVGEALVATAIGILVALPAIAFFNAFQRIIKARLARAEAFGHEVLAVLKAEHAPRTPAPTLAQTAPLRTANHGGASHGRSSRQRRRDDHGHQRHAARRHHPGAAGHPHGHRQLRRVASDPASSCPRARPARGRRPR